MLVYSSKMIRKSTQIQVTRNQNIPQERTNKIRKLRKHNKMGTKYLGSPYFLLYSICFHAYSLGSLFLVTIVIWNQVTVIWNWGTDFLISRKGYSKSGITFLKFEITMYWQWMWDSRPFEIREWLFEIEEINF